MAIGAHADDVELHFGGTLFKYIDRGYEPVYVMSTNNMSGSIRTYDGKGHWPKTISKGVIETMSYRKQETADAAALYGVEPIHLDHPQRKCYHPDGSGELVSLEVHFGSLLPEGIAAGVPTILTAFEHPEAVSRLSALILEKDPEVVLTQGHAEVNPEHFGTFLLVVKAYWQAVAGGYEGSLLYGPRRFAQLGRMACCWETFIDTTGYLEKRMESVHKHVSQYPPEFEHGVKHWRDLAEWRGSVCGVGAADVYNFVNPQPKTTATTEVLAELLKNQRIDRPWGLLSPDEIASCGDAIPRDQ